MKLQKKKQVNKNFHPDELRETTYLPGRIRKKGEHVLLKFSGLYSSIAFIPCYAHQVTLPA